MGFFFLFWLGFAEAIEHIQVGSFYEIDHSKLPPKAPEQFRSIRIVMVLYCTVLFVSFFVFLFGNWELGFG